MRWGINVVTSLCSTGDRYVGPAWWGFLSQNMPSVINPILRPILPSMSRNKGETHQNTLRRYIMSLLPQIMFWGKRVVLPEIVLGAAFNGLPCHKIVADTGSFNGQFGILIGFFQGPRGAFVLTNRVITDFFHIKDHTTDSGKAVGNGFLRPFS